MATIEEYTQLLRQHDWTHEWSDDYSKWKVGNEQIGVLRQLQPQLDPTAEIWNSNCHPEYQLKEIAK